MRTGALRAAFASFRRTALGVAPALASRRSVGLPLFGVWLSIMSLRSASSPDRLKLPLDIFHRTGQVAPSPLKTQMNNPSGKHWPQLK
jgi:hypothetical protein